MFIYVVFVVDCIDLAQARQVRSPLEQPMRGATLFRSYLGIAVDDL
jgi:hypothetical protein